MNIRIKSNSLKVNAIYGVILNIRQSLCWRWNFFNFNKTQSFHKIIYRYIFNIYRYMNIIFIILLQKIKLYIYEDLADGSATQPRKHPETHQWIVIHSLGNTVLSKRSSFAYQKAERNLRLKWNLTKAAYIHTIQLQHLTIQGVPSYSYSIANW